MENKFAKEDDKFIFCMSFANLVEIRAKKEIFIKFINVFSDKSFIMFYHYRNLIVEEHMAYKKKKQFKLNNEVMRKFTPEGETIETFVNKLPRRLKKQLDDEKEQLKEVTLSLNKKGKQFKLYLKENIIKGKEIRKWYNKIEKYIINKDLANECIKLKKDEDYTYFPSLRIMEYSLFLRQVMTEREIKLNDVMDIRISTFTPYVDVVITEGFQADVYKKAKKHIKELENLKIYTLRDI